ncbi:MAG: plastocyanin/azurin family copper-binding protein [Ignavibacteriales bacterium]|jgi:plastocyanin
MSTTRIAVVLGVISVLAVGLSIGQVSVYAQGASVSIVPNASTMGDKAFSPNPAEVKAGESVTWTNDDSQIHTATSGAVGAEDSGKVFDSGILSPKATFDFKFDQAGEVDYYCTLHPQMVGKVVVS